MFRDYFVPVPANWYPESVGEENELLVRIDTDASGSHEDRNPHASILLFAGKQQEGSQISELFNREEAFLKNKGGKEITSRTFDMSGETVFCLGGDQIDSGGAYKVNPTSWHCKATGGLDIRLIGSQADLHQAWDLVAHIRKK